MKLHFNGIWGRGGLRFTTHNRNTFKLCPIKRQWSECKETTKSNLTSLTTFSHRHAEEQGLETEISLQFILI